MAVVGAETGLSASEGSEEEEEEEEEEVLVDQCSGSGGDVGATGQDGGEEVWHTFQMVSPIIFPAEREFFKITNDVNYFVEADGSIEKNRIKIRWNPGVISERLF